MSCVSAEPEGRQLVEDLSFVGDEAKDTVEGRQPVGGDENELHHRDR